MSGTIRDAVADGIAFIETHLQQPIGVSDVASAVSFSQFYFSREFTRHTHISVYDYILRRKLSESYKELFGRKCKIIDLACRYGFQSHEVYTRAFRKMFGENPSEASEYKPLAVFEPIGGAYLDFLSGLRVEIVGGPAADYSFEVTDASPDFAPDGGDLLVSLSMQNPWQRRMVFRGRLSPAGSGALSFPLHGARHILRLSPAGPCFAFRFYTDNFHGTQALTSNYVLLRSTQTYTDILIPAAP